MKKFSFRYFAAILLATTACSSRAASVFSEDFGSLANGTTITTANTGLNYTRTGTGTPFLYATNDQFSGASALMYASGGSLTGIGETNLAAFNVGTLNFSIYSSATLSAFAFFVGTGPTFTGSSTFGGADLTAGFQFLSGQLQTRTSANAWANVGAVGFTGGTAYSISMVFNNTASSVAYGSYSVGAGTADFWVNGTLFGDDVSIRGAQSTTAFRMYTTTSGTPLEVDDIQLFDNAVDPTPVPEPSTFALASIGGLACLLAFRRKR